MSEQLVPNIYDVLHSGQSSPWLRDVLRNALSDVRDPRQVACDARLLAAMLDARAEDWSSSVRAGADGERQVALVDVFLPLEEPCIESARGNVVAVDFPGAAWRSNAGI